MQKKIFLCLCLSAPLFLAANEYPDRGFYGSLGFMYMEDEYTAGSDHTAKDNFTQEYKLGYGGNIYSPKLLDYIIEGTLRNDIENYETDSYESKQKSLGHDYKTNLNFIKNTKFPFTIYASRYEKPINTVYSAYSTNYIFETKNEGASGSINFEPYSVTYGASNTKSTSEFDDRLQESQTKTYNTSFRYTGQKHNFQASYMHNEMENEQQYITDSLQAVDQIKDLFSITDSWNASDDLRVHTNASYENDKAYMTETIDGDLNLYWAPKEEKYDGSLSVYASNIEYGNDLGGEKYIFNSMNINQVLNYKLTDTLYLTENAMAYIYDATSVKGANTHLNLYATHNYATTLFENMPFTFTTRLGAQRNNSTSEMTLNNVNTTTSSSVDRYSLDLRAGVRRELPSIKSSLNFDTGYYTSMSSIDEEEQRYNLNLYLLSRVYGNVGNNITARYMQTSRTNVSIVSDEAIKSDYSLASIMEALDFSFSFGARGKMNFLVGAEYISRKSNDVTEQGLNPRADVNMNYRLFQRWTFDASARMSEMYNIIEHSGNANLTFRAGKTTFLMGYQYNKSQVDSVLSAISNERSVFKMQLTREF